MAGEHLVVAGQIVSLFGNAAIRFALPLYLLNLTGSAALYGMVTACAFVPSVILSPFGGMIADRVNKRNIMVLLDFFTAALTVACSLLLGSVDLVLLLTVTLMLLYGIAGAYQPSVQASIPALVSPEQFMAANSVINMVASFAALTGPVLGGVLYSAYGLHAVLRMCAVCFAASAVMELFIRIPFAPQPAAGSVWRTVKTDIADSLRFIAREKPAIGKAMLVVCGVMIGYICSAITDFVVTFAEDSNIVNLHNWSLGSFSGTSWDNVALMAWVVGIAFLLAFLLSKPIGAYQMGEAYARSMGVDIRMFRVILIVLSSVFSACVTAFAGPISFVGIAVPQLVKLALQTSKPLIVIPASFLGGAVFCMFCDLTARMAFAPLELNISTVTSVFGAPVVIWMLIRRSAN